MNATLLPEAIRGGWYLVSSEADLDEGLDEEAEILVFRLEGTFTRYEIEEEERRESERGDYTFDGQFLILRGSNTETYRVEPQAAWRWSLEGKKNDYLLLRGPTGQTAETDLSAERAEAIDRMPMRVLVRSVFDGDQAGEVSMLLHESDDETVELGALFAEPPESGEMWIGLTPLVEGLSSETWKKVVGESYLEIYRDDVDGVARVTLHLFGRDEDVVIERG